jgi:hypothetical protein
MRVALARSDEMKTPLGSCPPPRGQVPSGLGEYASLRLLLVGPRLTRQGPTSRLVSCVALQVRPKLRVVHVTRHNPKALVYLAALLIDPKQRLGGNR